MPDFSALSDRLQDVRELIIPAHYCGPHDSGNGGWVSGRLAEMLLAQDAPGAQDADAGMVAADASVTVTLRMPPPLDRPLAVVRAADGAAVELLDLGNHGDGDDGGESGAKAGTSSVVEPLLVASAAPGPRLPAPPVFPEVSPEELAAAQERFPGRRAHAYPRCYACGIERSQEDSVALTPGPLDDSPSADDGPSWWVAAWLPHEVSVANVWAALDCPTGWAAGVEDRYLLLGRMSAQVRELPPAQARCVVFARRTGGEGRKALAESFLCHQGRVLAQAETVWIDAGAPPR